MLVIYKNKDLGDCRYQFIPHNHNVPLHDKAIMLTPRVQTHACIKFNDWYKLHKANINSIKHFILERLALNPFLTYSTNVHMTRKLAEFVYKHSSCSYKHHKFLK